MQLTVMTVVFNNEKWNSYTPQQLKRPKTIKLSCTKTVQKKKYISVNYLLMEEKLNFLKLQKEKFIEEHNKKMEIYQKKGSAVRFTDQCIR
ncbi:unnamed protein product [Acanthoscelides obtectus]|nr:unnamed protein product [Acanthoscelides obtectus]CAK1637911.1 hypothetical protein AOBTE_LOCUS10285 [Acanthoscelides obtectus]